jgi:hypothetical protein
MRDDAAPQPSARSRPRLSRCSFAGAATLAALALAGAALAACAVPSRPARPSSTIARPDADASPEGTPAPRIAETKAPSGAARQPPPAPPAGARYLLRARGADVHGLLGFAARSPGRAIVVGPEVTGTLSLDLERDSLPELEEEVARASGAGSLVMGRSILVGGPARLAAARRHPQLPALARGDYKGRRVIMQFTRIRLSNLLGLLADVSQRPFELADGVEERVSIGARELRWTELLDVLAVAGDLTRQEADGAIRIARRGDAAPRFTRTGREIARDEPPEPSTSGKPRKNRCGSPVGEVEVARMRLVAILIGIPTPEALVRLPSGKEYVVRKGSCLGLEGGTVTSVERDRLVVLDDPGSPARTHRDGEQVLNLDGT